MDSIDRQIVNELQIDAGLPVESLGERVGLSRNACWRRVKQLEQTGVIKGRVALVDPESVGLPLSVFIQVKAAKHDKNWAESFAQATRDLPEILGVYRMSGDLDYLIRAQVADMGDYDRLYQLLISRIDMADMSASFVMEKIKDSTMLRL